MDIDALLNQTSLTQNDIAKFIGISQSHLSKKITQGRLGFSQEPLKALQALRSATLAVHPDADDLPTAYTPEAQAWAQREYDKLHLRRTQLEVELADRILRQRHYWYTHRLLAWLYDHLPHHLSNVLYKRRWLLRKSELASHRAQQVLNTRHLQLWVKIQGLKSRENSLLSYLPAQIDQEFFAPISQQA